MTRRERPSARLLPQAAPTKPEADVDSQPRAADSTKPSPSEAANSPAASDAGSPSTATSTKPSDGPTVEESAVAASTRTGSSAKTMNRTNWSLLDELDARQTELLDQLAELDRRVEALLRECLTGRGEGEGGMPDRAANAQLPSKEVSLDPVDEEAIGVF